VEEGKMKEPEFRLEASFDSKTGCVVAVYLRVRSGPVGKTEEIREGVAYADYAADGSLLGVELLGPCDVEVLERIARTEPERVRGFLKSGAPRGLVATASE
jgi:hypothetical protein